MLKIAGTVVLGSFNFVATFSYKRVNKAPNPNIVVVKADVANSAFSA